MITINGIDIDFDITSPRDLLRLDAAEKAVTEKASALPGPPQDKSAPDYLVQYARWLDSLLNLFGNFIDGAFGDGVAEKLLTGNPSLTRVMEVNEQLSKVLDGHVEAVTSKFSKYKPNRATRRTK